MSTETIFSALPAEAWANPSTQWSFLPLRKLKEKQSFFPGPRDRFISFSSSFLFSYLFASQWGKIIFETFFARSGRKLFRIPSFPLCRLGAVCGSWTVVNGDKAERMEFMEIFVCNDLYFFHSKLNFYSIQKIGFSNVRINHLEATEYLPLKTTCLDLLGHQQRIAPFGSNNLILLPQNNNDLVKWKMGVTMSINKWCSGGNFCYSFFSIWLLNFFPFDLALGKFICVNFSLERSWDMAKWP